MTQLILFGISFLYGGVLRVAYFLQALLAKKTNIRVVTVILDFFWCAAAAVGFFLISLFFAGGTFCFFMLCGALAGFFLVAVWL